MLKLGRLLLGGQSGRLKTISFVEEKLYLPKRQPFELRKCAKLRPLYIMGIREKASKNFLGNCINHFIICIDASFSIKNGMYVKVPSDVRISTIML